MFCPNCGETLGEGSRFCKSCGCEVRATQPLDSTWPASAQTAPNGVNPSQATQVMPQVQAAASTGQAVPGAVRQTVAQTPNASEHTSGDNGNKKKAIIAAAIAAVLIVAAVVGFTALHGKAGADDTQHAVILSLDSDSYTSASDASRIPVQVSGTDADGNQVENTQYVDSKGEGLEVPTGNYTLSFPASPIGKDGQMWDMPSDSVILTVTDSSAEQAQAVTLADADMASITDDQIKAAQKYMESDSKFSNKAQDYADAATKARDKAVDDADADAAKDAAEAEAKAKDEAAAADQADKNAAIAEAEANGYTVLTGTVVTQPVSAHLERLGITNLYNDLTGGGKYDNNETLLYVDPPVTISVEAGDAQGYYHDTYVQTVLLNDLDMSAYEGQTITLAFEKLYTPTDVGGALHSCVYQGDVQILE